MPWVQSPTPAQVTGQLRHLVSRIDRRRIAVLKSRKGCGATGGISAQNETFFRDARCSGMKQSDIWYVTYGPDKADENAASMARSTRTFKSEVDAKLFAMQILAKGWTASAGTLNPHQPKRVVGPSQIESWADPGLGG
jgi:hypothetical protein